MFNVTWRRWLGVFTNGSRRLAGRKPQPFQRGFRPLLETLEERLVPTSTPTITPTTFADLAISSLADVNSQGQILDQGNAITLRSAIIAANARTNGVETIDLLAGTYTLTQGPGDDDSGNATAQLTGDLDIVNSTAQTSYTIMGQGSGSTFINAATLGDRIFDVDAPFGGSQLSLTVQGVTLENGDAASPNGAGGDGGAIRFDGINGDNTAAGTLTLTDVHIVNNQSTDNVAGGVEVFGSADFTNCVFSGNTANGGGGGAFVDNGIPGSTLTISNCSFTGNQALDPNFGTGGALLLQGGTTLSINNSIITGNQAGTDGGGISILNAGAVTITNTIIAGNSAGNSGNGGGIAVNNTPPFDTSTVAVNDNLIAGNSAGTGAGLAYVAGTADIDATDNFWGSNANPATVNNLITDAASGAVNSNPWLELAVSASPNNIPTSGTSTVTASLATDSNGAAVASLPPTIPIAFASGSGLGTLNPPSTNLVYPSGSVTSTYTAGAVTGSDNVTATLEDSEAIGTSIAIMAAAAPTTTTVTSSPSVTSSYGVSVQFTATVTKTSNSASVGSAGTVSFDIDGVPYAPAANLPLNASGLASFSIDNLPVTANPHDITAFYSGVTNQYVMSQGDVNQAITAANLTVTANSRSKTYGQTVTFAGTEFTTSGLQNGETIGSVSLTSSGAAPTAPVSGSPYAIMVCAATGGTFNPNNYSISYVNGLLTVNRANLTVSADNLNKPYGQTYTFAGTEFSASGLQNGETIGSVTLSSSGTASTAPVSGNPYAISISAAAGGTLNPNNYNNITYLPGVLTVTKAILTLTAPSLSKVYGAALPTLTASLSGVVNNDGITAVCATTATATSDVVAGGYPITAALFDPLGRLSNYTVVYTPGVLTITPAPQTIIWSNPANIAYPAALGSAQLDATVSVVGPAAHGALIYTPISGTILNAGNNQSLQVYAASTNDYSQSATKTVSINVTPAPLTITANNDSKPYGTLKTFSNSAYSEIGLVNGDTITGVTETSTGAPAAANAGTYPIVPSAAVGTGLGNYTITYVHGTLTVNPLQVTVTLSGLTAVVNGGQHAVIAAAAGYTGAFTITYTGTAGTIYGPSTSPPSLAGAYAVVAVPQNTNYVAVAGTGIGTLTIGGPAPAGTATVTLGNLSQTFGNPLPVTATTNPAHLIVNITYASATYLAQATPPTHVGSYTVTATIAAGQGYTGSTRGTLVIAQATPVITWILPATIPFGTALSTAYLDATANVAGNFVYTPGLGVKLAKGANILSVTFTPNDSGYLTVTMTVVLTVV